MIETPVYTISGEETTLQSLAHGKPLYVKFWASWCQPCLQQMAHFEKKQKQFKENIAVIGVNIGINNNIESIKKIRTDYQLTMPIVIDKTGALAASADLRGTPYHVLVNRAGDVTFTGHKANQQLDEALQSLTLDERVAVSSAHTNIDDSQHQAAVANSAVLYTSTWCDWYLQKSRPAISKNCVKANQMLDTLAGRFPNLKWEIVVSRLWTDKKERQEYQSKYALKTPISIDLSNQQFRDREVKDYPTLIVTDHAGKELRINQFENYDAIEKQIADVLK